MNLSPWDAGAGSRGRARRVPASARATPHVPGERKSNGHHDAAVRGGDADATVAPAEPPNAQSHQNRRDRGDHGEDLAAVRAEIRCLAEAYVGKDDPHDEQPGRAQVEKSCRELDAEGIELVERR